MASLQEAAGLNTQGAVLNTRIAEVQDVQKEVEQLRTEVERRGARICRTAILSTHAIEFKKLASYAAASACEGSAYAMTVFARAMD
ncbi:MAG: hypothetical protein ACLPX8_17965 [Bryobacteraceae bacterium]